MKVKCKICKKELNSINNSHLRKHNLSVREYKKLFGNDTISSELRKKYSLANKKKIPWNIGLTKEIDIRVQRMSDKLKGTTHSELHKKRISKSLKGKTKGRKSPFKGIAYEEQFGRKIANKRKKRLSEIHKGKTVSKETRKILSELKKETTWKNEKNYEIRLKNVSIKYSGKNNPNWRGGLSNLPYPIEYNKKYRNKIRKRDNSICQICKRFIEDDRKVTVHHIDYNKDNLNPNNSILLCNICHGKTGYSRSIWKEVLGQYQEDRFYGSRK